MRIKMLILIMMLAMSSFTSTIRGMLYDSSGISYNDTFSITYTLWGYPTTKDVTLKLRGTSNNPDSISYWFASDTAIEKVVVKYSKKGYKVIPNLSLVVVMCPVCLPQTDYTVEIKKWIYSTYTLLGVKDTVWLVYPDSIYAHYNTSFSPTQLLLQWPRPGVPCSNQNYVAVDTATATSIVSHSNHFSGSKSAGHQTTYDVQGKVILIQPSVKRAVIVNGKKAILKIY
jgi:hypothetical protein